MSEISLCVSLCILQAQKQYNLYRYRYNLGSLVYIAVYLTNLIINIFELLLFYD